MYVHVRSTQSEDCFISLQPLLKNAGADQAKDF